MGSVKEEVRQKLWAVIMALNNIHVKGKQDMASMVGSINILEELYERLGRKDVSVETVRADPERKGVREDGVPVEAV